MERASPGRLIGGAIKKKAQPKLRLLCDCNLLRSGEVDVALDCCSGDAWISKHQYPPRPDHAEGSVWQEAAAHVIAGRFAGRLGHGMRFIQRGEAQLLSGLKDGAIDAPRLRVVATIVDAHTELGTILRDGEPGITVASRTPRDVLTLPGLALVRRGVEHDAIRVRVARRAAKDRIGISEAFQLPGVDVDGVDGAIGRDLYTGPTKCGVERFISSHVVTLPCFCVV